MLKKFMEDKFGERGWGWMVAGFLLIIITGIFRCLFEILRHIPEGSSDT